MQSACFTSKPLVAINLFEKNNLISFNEQTFILLQEALKEFQELSIYVCETSKHSFHHSKIVLRKSFVEIN